MLLYKAAWIVLLVFAFIGVTIVATFFHEYNHYQDLKSLALEDSICVLNYEPGFEWTVGYYAFSYNTTDQYKVDDIQKNTELKSYIISIFIVAIFVTAVWYIAYINFFKHSTDESSDDNYISPSQQSDLSQQT